MQRPTSARQVKTIWICIAALVASVFGIQASQALRNVLGRDEGPRVSPLVSAVHQVAAEPAPVRSATQNNALANERADLLVDAMVQVESGGDPNRVGDAGERGLLQIREGTWRQVTKELFGRSLPFAQAFDPELNRRVAKGYLAELQGFLSDHREAWRGDERTLLLACYNAGPNRIREGGFDPQRIPASTKSYVTRVVALHDLYLSRAEPATADMATLVRPVKRLGS